MSLAIAVVLVSIAFVASLCLPAPRAAASVGFCLAVTPDLIDLASIRGFVITARIAVLMAVLIGIIFNAARGRLRIRVPFSILWLLLLVAVLAGCIDQHRVLGFLQYLVVVFGPFLAGASLSAITTIRGNLLRGIALGAVAIGVVALLERIRGSDFLVTEVQAQAFYRAGSVRVDAGWAYPVALGAFLALVIFPTVTYLRRYSWVVALGASSCLLLAMIFTQARASLFGAASGAFALVCVQRTLKNAIRLTGVLSVVALVGLFGLGSVSSSIKTFVSDSFIQGSIANANISYRENIYHFAGPAIATHPWFGFGYGSSQSISTNQLSQYFGDFTDLASLPLALVVETGFVGAILFAAIWACSLVRVARRRTTMNAALTASMVAGTVASIGVVGVSTLFWMSLVAGIAAASQNDETNPAPHDMNSALGATAVASMAED